MKIIKVEQSDPSLMHLTWLINNICPNKCSYCPSDLHNGTNHNYDWDNARRFFDVLFERYPKIHCSVSGGEASVSPFFREIVEIFHNKGHTIGVTSNAAKPATYWSNISPFLNYICFSYHPEFPDANFIEKITAASENTFVTARVMMHPKHWDDAVDMYNKLYALEKVFTESVRIFNWGGNSDSSASEYTNEQLDWINSNTGNQTKKYLYHLTGKQRVVNMIPKIFFDDGTIDQRPNTVNYINAGMTNFNEYECEVGVKSLFINFNGDVFLANCQIHGAIGNINDPDNIKWPTMPVLCNKNLCHCTSDVEINKKIVL